jgi:hypothetical protein
MCWYSFSRSLFFKFDIYICDKNSLSNGEYMWAAHRTLFIHQYLYLHNIYTIIKEKKWIYYHNKAQQQIAMICSRHHMCNLDIMSFLNFHLNRHVRFRDYYGFYILFVYYSLNGRGILLTRIFTKKKKECEKDVSITLSHI